MSEVALAGRRGFYASFQYMTLIGGQLAAIGGSHLRELYDRYVKARDAYNGL